MCFNSLQKMWTLLLTSFLILYSIDLYPKTALTSNTELISVKTMPNASITGTTTRCQYTGNVQITLTGSGGNAPYTFTYNATGMGLQTITTLGSNNSINIAVGTNTSGTFNYSLVSVEDDDGDSSSVSGTATVTITQAPNTNMNGTGAGTTFEGLRVFRICQNNISEFTFTNSSPTASTINTGYTIDWGDGTAPFTGTGWTSLNHTYDVGIYTLIYTITGSTGCDSTENYTVFVGSNPAVSLGNPGNTDICNISSLTFPITGTENNPPGTTYTVTFNDGSPPQNFNHPPPASVSHLFDVSSCGTVSSDGSNAYANSFSANIIAANPCSTSSVGVVPIYVSVTPMADIEMDEVACTNQEVCFENISLGDENNGSNAECDTSPAILWSISPNTGFTITSGELGNDFGLSDPNLWLSGSDFLCVNFTQVGTYDVTINTANRCGIDMITKTICVESPLIPSFDLSATQGCGPLSLDTTNNTDTSNNCEAAEYLWAVNYTSDFCGSVPETWSFTNSSDENSESPSFNLENAGTYIISLTTTNSCGSETTTQTVEVKKPPEATISAINDSCGSASITPIATIDTCAPTSDTVTYQWDFPGGTPTSSNSANPGTIDYTSIGNYTVSLTVTNSCGSISTTEDFSVNPSPTILNTDVTQTICSGASTSEIIFNSDITGTTYTWSSNNPVGLTGFLPSGITDNIPAQLITSTNATTTTLIYTVIPSFQGCDGAPINFEIEVIAAPSITTQPQSSEVCENGTATLLTIAFTGTGTPTYQWFENSIDDTTSGTAISGATTDTFDPPTDVVGTTYYYCEITFSSGGCSEIISVTAEVTVTDGISIDSEPTVSQSICEGGEASILSVVTSGGAGNLIYQWFSNTINANTGGSLISGATSDSYQPPVFDFADNYYFYVEVSSNGNGCQSVISNVSEIIVVSDPIVDTQPLPSQQLCQNSTAADLVVTVSGGLGIISYQWYSNITSDNTSGTLISGETNSIFSPPTDMVGTLYYYCVISQDVSGCETISAISEVVISTAANFVDQPISDILCLGESTPDLIVSYEDGTGTPTYQWFQNTIDDTVSGTLIAGATAATYSPDVTSIGTTYYYCVITFQSGGCSEIISDTAEIIINVTPSISDATELICSANSFDHIPDISSGDIVPINTAYTWGAPTILPAGSIIGATEQLTPISTISQFLQNTTTSPATVTYTVTPTSGICTGAAFEILVTVNPSISIIPTVTNDACFQSGGGSIAIEISGGVPFSTPPDYQIMWTGPDGFSSTSEDISGLEPGLYSLTINDDGGCPFSADFTLTEPDLLVFSGIVFDPETISCFGANDGEINIDISGGTLPYQVNWIKDGSPFSNAQDLTNLGPGTYEITATDANNCGPIISTFIIDEPEQLSISAMSSNDIICFGDASGNIDIAVSGGRLPYQFIWDGPDGFSAITEDITSLIAGIYNLEVTDQSGCTENFSLELFQNTEIAVDVTVTEISCYNANDASITINSISGGVPGYQVAWSNFATGMSQDNLSDGTYIITITDAANCVKNFTYTIAPAPDFFVQPEVTQLSCFGENDASIVLNFVGGENPVDVNWSDDPSAGTDRFNLGPGTYSVTIIDGAPCTIEETFTIFDIDELSVSANITDALDCDDVNTGSINILVTGGTLPYSFSWSNGATTEDLDSIASGNYFLTIEDANGCILEADWEVIRFEPIVLNVDTQTVADCDAKTVDQTFVAVASGGVPPFTFNWSSGTVSGANNEIMTTGLDGLVILDVNDSLGCTETYSLNVETPILGNPGFQTESFGFNTYGIYAILDPIQFTNEATGDYTNISWDFGDGNFSSEENPIHTYTAEGTYIVTQTVRYPFGCVYTEVISLVVEKGYRLIMPNAFTPNEDSLNDFFGPEHIGLDKMTLEIFDTWGSMIYSEKGDDIQGWDGKVKDTDAENGNYYFTFSASTFYGNIITAQGAFVYLN